MYTLSIDKDKLQHLSCARENYIEYYILKDRINTAETFGLFKQSLYLFTLDTNYKLAVMERSINHIK